MIQDRSKVIKKCAQYLLREPVADALQKLARRSGTVDLAISARRK